VTYLDTGCFVKLYYPEPDSAQVIVVFAFVFLGALTTAGFAADSSQ